MSYESKLDPQSHKLVSPVQLCLLLSVVLHLLVLRFGLPTIRFNNDGGQREVSVIELNPEQQARLPDLYPQLQSDSNLNLPQPDLDDPAAPFAIPPDLIPGITDPANLPPLIIPPPPTFDIPALPPVTDITLPPVGDLSDLPLPPQIDPLDFKVEPLELPPNIGQVPEVPTVPEVSDSPDPAIAANPDQPLEQEPKQKPTEAIPQIQPRETPEQIAARKLTQSQERIKNLRQSLTKTDDGTSEEEARKNYVAWLAKVKDIEPEQLEFIGTYPRDACIKRLEGSSVFGVVVNVEGEVVALDLLKGAKYPIFNQQASETISDRLFENETEKPKPYQVKVNYEYDSEICPSLTLPSIRSQEPSSTPQAQPQPTPAPEPTTPQAQPQSTPVSEPTTPQAQPQPTPVSEPTTPSLRNQLRDVPLPELNLQKLKDVPLPDKPNFN